MREGDERTWLAADEAATEAVGRTLGELLKPNGVVLLDGDLGVGKTVLVRGLAAALGIPGGEVQSPSYTLIHEHQGPGGRLVHVDLYRLTTPEVDGLGLDEILAGGGLVAIEWPERLPSLPAEARRVALKRNQDGGRVIVLGAS